MESIDPIQNLEGWAKVAVLGSGSFGIVTLWKHMKSHECVAIKKCRWMQPESIPQKQRERWIQEVDFMKFVRHENIVQFKQLPHAFLLKLEASNPSGLPLLSMEYCDGGNLRRFINLPENACGLREDAIRNVLGDLSAGLMYLHQQQITHRDIKPENVVIQPRKSRPIYKIIDLGYAKDMNLLTSYVGTVAYTAPEIFMNTSYNHSVDYWSLGVLAYEICCGKHPFLPSVAPVERFRIIANKSSQDICIYKAQSNKIIYTHRILEPLHISSCLRTHLEAWLGTMLEFDGKQRGVAAETCGESVFSALNKILEKKIVDIFSVYNYSRFHYEIDDGMSVNDLQCLLQKDSQLEPNQQLMLTSSHAINMRICKLQVYPHLMLDDLRDAHSGRRLVFYLFKRGEFIPSQTVVLPAEVKQLLQQNRHQWNELKMRTTNAVHYIEQETNYMKATISAICQLYESVNGLISEENELKPILWTAMERLLHLIEFCKEIKCNWGSSLQVYKKILWRARELVENVNSANGRYHKLRTKGKRLKISHDRITKYFKSLDIDNILHRAKNCLQINKQKVVITAKDIAIVICSCLKMRKEIQQNKEIAQHLRFCFKLLSEYTKITKWMHALTVEAKRTYTEILNEQRQPSSRNNQAASIGNIQLSWDATKHLQIISENRTLRFRMQERFNELLQCHKLHANSVAEFVCYANALNSA